MEHYLKVFASNPLFENIPEDALLPLLHCLDAQKKSFRKGAYLFESGEQALSLGIVLSGIVRAEATDILGNRSIISQIHAGQLFNAAYSSTKEQKLPVDIVAQTDCVVMLIETARIFGGCTASEQQRIILQANLIHILAQNYADLGCKVIHLSARSTRKKLLSYLSEQYRFANGKPFVVPFNQQELADYLFIERSGLCTELNRLKKEGVLQIRNNLYTLRQIPE